MRSPPSDIEAELDKIASESKSDLRQRYVALFGREPPKAFGPDLLRRTVAYHVQEIALGGLSKTSQRMLDKLVATLLQNPSGKLVLPRQAQLGVILVREWKGKSHHVTMLDQGFAYQGRTYTSLSEIAREITGTRWNGPRFFGLRKQPASVKDDADKGPPSPTPARSERRPRPEHGIAPDRPSGPFGRAPGAAAGG